jgi:hypothetical protein
MIFKRFTIIAIIILLIANIIVLFFSLVKIYSYFSGFRDALLENDSMNKEIQSNLKPISEVIINQSIVNIVSLIIFTLFLIVFILFVGKIHHLLIKKEI